MTLTVDLARELLESPKWLVPPFDWQPSGRLDRRRLEDQLSRPFPAERFDMTCAVRIGGTVPRGLRFRFSTFPRRPFSAVFQLECRRVPAERAMHILYRMEWHPLRGHLNGFDCAPDIAGRLFEDGESHHHSCLDHASPDGLVRAGDVHAARPWSLIRQIWKALWPSYVIP